MSRDSYVNRESCKSKGKYAIPDHCDGVFNEAKTFVYQKRTECRVINAIRSVQQIIYEIF